MWRKHAPSLSSVVILMLIGMSIYAAERLLRLQRLSFVTLIRIGTDDAAIIYTYHRVLTALIRVGPLMRFGR